MLSEVLHCVNQLPDTDSVRLSVPSPRFTMSITSGAHARHIFSLNVSFDERAIDAREVVKVRPMQFAPRTFASRFAATNHLGADCAGQRLR